MGATEGGRDGSISHGSLTPAAYVRLARELRAAGDGRLDPIRIAFLSTFNLEFVEPFLVVEAAALGWKLDSYFSDFGVLEQEAMSADSGLYRFRPDALVVAARPEDLDPDCVVRHHAANRRGYDVVASELMDRLDGVLAAFRARSAATALVANFAHPLELPLGPFDAGSPDTITYAVTRANTDIRDRVAAVADATVWDYAGLVREQGVARWTDRRLWALARIPVAAVYQPILARQLMRTLSGQLRVPAKCLILDLDNTLWGGEIGDDGIEGIQLGDDYPGNAYKTFQRAVLGLADRGVLLAVASKNDRAVVQRVFDEHPEMLIRWSDLTAVRINWGTKSQNIREIAAELNLGVDAMALFDDNPVERAEVRVNAPEVQVIEVPPDPLAYADALRSAYAFDQPRISTEDRVRSRLYHEQHRRAAFATTFATVEEFLAKLEMVAEVGEVDATTLARVVQLVNKTNQFNLTTRRMNEAQVRALAADPDSVAAWVRVRDRFGDQGLVAVGILRRRGTTGTIDNLLMSCRLINRGVEQTLLAYLVERARHMGVQHLVGDYVPTRKNAIVADLYTRYGFTIAEVLPGGGKRFELDLAARSVDWPAFIAKAVVRDRVGEPATVGS